MEGEAKSNDRRILTIGVTTMVVFLLIGVGSAAVFSRPACRLVAPTFVALDVTVGSDNDPLAAFGNDDLARFVAAVDQAVERDVTAVDAFGSDRLTLFGPRLAAIGASVLLFDDMHRPTGQVLFRDATVVGGGDALYALALTNPTSGQIDALQPIGSDLTARTCVELALVSTPLAFFLDAADGEVLLLRADEDGEEPFVEVRDPNAGRRLETPVELTIGSAGQHGVRTAGVFFGGLIVFSQALTSTPNDTVVWGIDRNDGSIRFTVSAQQVRDVANITGDVAVSLRRNADGVALVLADDDREILLDVADDDGALALTTDIKPQLALSARYTPVFSEHPQVTLRDIIAYGNTDVLLVSSGEHTIVLHVPDAR
ncbi:MAG: hypothetical protein WD360_03265 [Nitriliruptoraceae bacterium]